MDDSRLQFGCQSFIILLVVRYRSIQKRPIFDPLADTEFRSGKVLPLATVSFNSI